MTLAQRADFPSRPVEWNIARLADHYPAVEAISSVS
jgi:hypothetical protein